MCVEPLPVPETGREATRQSVDACYVAVAVGTTVHSAECCADAQQVPPCRKAVGLAAVHEQQTAWQPPIVTSRSPGDGDDETGMFPSLWSI
jgi:hypothetical protein